MMGKKIRNSNELKSIPLPEFFKIYIIKTFYSIKNTIIIPYLLFFVLSFFTLKKQTFLSDDIIRLLLKFILKYSYNHTVHPLASARLPKML